MLMLLDRDEKLIASLKYNDIRRKREINGINTLELECKREVEEGQRLLFKDKEGLWNEYIIFDYFDNHDKEGVTYSVYAEDVTSELYWFHIDDLKPRNETASSLLGRILDGTRFEVGYVDNFPKKSFNLYRTSVKAALWKILEEYGAEINVRIIVENDKGIIHRYIDLRNKIGKDLGKRFTYKKDMESVKKTTSYKDLVTALYGYGKGEEIVKEDGTPSNEDKIGGGDYGRKIDFAEVNNGKKYVTNEEARLKYGIGKERKHKYGRVEFDDCEDKKELLELTKEKLKELSKPKITYELNVEDISRYEGYVGEGVGLGDIVIVDDKEIDTLVQTRVVSLSDNPLEEIEDSEIVLGNFIKDLSDNDIAYDKLKSAFENNRYRFNDELQKLSNGVKTSYMQEVLDKFNKELNETGGWVYAEEGEGLLILNAPKEGNPTQAINLKGGKIAIANHKNADGSFAYETFGDGDGFTANLIRAGILRGGNVFFNLEDGTFLIGESRTNYSMYWDGSILHMRNVDIDLSNNEQIGDINNSLGTINSDIKNQSEEILSMKNEFKLGVDGLKSSFSSKTKELEDSILTSDKNLRTYISNNYSTISQTSNMIETKISSLNTRLGNAETRISQTANELSSKVSKNEFGTRIRQSAYDVKIAWNDISNYIQFEHGSIGIYNGSVTSSKKRSMFDENGIHFYRDGYYVGKIGTNRLTNNESGKGLVFDLDYDPYYMCWAAKDKRDGPYMIKWLYSNRSFDRYVYDNLNAGCDIDMRGYTLKNVHFEGGGITGTMNFKQITSMDSDGTANSWANASMTFKNGILVSGRWSG